MNLPVVYRLTIYSFIIMLSVPNVTSVSSNPGPPSPRVLKCYECIAFGEHCENYCEAHGELAACTYHETSFRNGSVRVERGCDPGHICQLYELPLANAGNFYCCNTDYCNWAPLNGTVSSGAGASAIHRRPFINASKRVPMTPTISIATTPFPSSSDGSNAQGLAYGLAGVFGAFIFLGVVVGIVCFVMWRANRRSNGGKSKETVNGPSRSSNVYVDHPPSNAVGGTNMSEVNEQQAGVHNRPGSSAPATYQYTRMCHNIELEQKIGQGAFGEVWRGTYLRDPVAVKIFDGRIAQSFYKEKHIYLRAITASSHENILGYKGCDLFINKETNGEQMWLITDYCEVGSLLAYLHGHTIANVDLLLDLCYDLCNGLSYLHHGFMMGDKIAVAHRDLKPSNIFLRRRGNGTVMCVIGDFGLSVCNKEPHASNKEPASSSKSVKNAPYQVAKSTNPQHDDVESEVTEKLLVGTVRYMAPEILSGQLDVKNFDKLKAADVYSLALVMWEMAMRTKIAGQQYENRTLPFEELDRCLNPYLDRMRQVVHVEKRRPYIPKFWAGCKKTTRLAQIIEECWHQDLGARLSALRAKYNVDDIRNGKAIGAVKNSQ